MKITGSHFDYLRSQTDLVAEFQLSIDKTFDQVLHASMEAHMRHAIHKEVAELTSEEKFAICYFAGVRIESRVDMAKEPASVMSLATEPCAISKIDGKFIVAVHSENKAKTPGTVMAPGAAFDTDKG